LVAPDLFLLVYLDPVTINLEISEKCAINKKTLQEALFYCSKFIVGKMIPQSYIFLRASNYFFSTIKGAEKKFAFDRYPEIC